MKINVSSSAPISAIEKTILFTLDTNAETFVVNSIGGQSCSGGGCRFQQTENITP